MKTLSTLWLTILILSVSAFAQIETPYETWGCSVQDFKCQLDVRMKALQADPKNPENYYNLGIVFQRSGAHKEAIETFSMYILIPGLSTAYQADGYNNRGISQRSLRKFELAYADYTKAIELNPKKKAQFLVNRGNVDLDLGKPAEALADYSAAIAADATYALAYTNRGGRYYALNRLDDALNDLTRAIELDATNPEPLYTRAQVYRARGEFKKAIPDLDKYIGMTTNPQYLGDAYLNRGIARASLGDLDAALVDLTKAVETTPTYPDAYGARAYVYRQLKKNDLAEADEKKFAALRKP